MDVIKLTMPLYIRLLELVREDIKGDEGIHFLAEITSHLAKTDPLTMSSYQKITDYLKAAKQLA